MPGVHDVAQAPSPALPAKPACAEYRGNLPHLQRANKPHVVTFTRHRRTLGEPLRAIVLSYCLHDRKRTALFHAAVAIPDHVHLLCTPLCDSQRSPYGRTEIMRGIKGASARPQDNHRRSNACPAT